MLFRLARRLSITSPKFFLLLTGASAMFVYLVSPLRDPAFQPMGANGGSQVWWLQGVREHHWMLAAFILAGPLAINLTFNLWQWHRSETDLTAHQHREGIQSRLVNGVMYLGIVIGMWCLLYYVFLFYLLMQYLVD